eukprot:Nk52_evm25s913 gene=Nk52_evmTU25s913
MDVDAIVNHASNLLETAHETAIKHSKCAQEGLLKLNGMASGTNLTIPAILGVQSTVISVKDLCCLIVLFTIAWKFLLRPFFRVLYSMYAFFVRPRISLKRIGSWAVVTGATDGIGRGYVEEFARLGLNVVLIGRSEEKLKTVSSEVRAKFPKIDTMELVCDFSVQDRDFYGDMKLKLEKLPNIAVLVNNVGVSYQFPEYFMDISDERVNQLIDINIVAATMMTRIVLPLMVKNAKSKTNTSSYGGAVINIGSASGYQPNALLGQYSASKAYTDFLSRALSEEMSKYPGLKKPIIVQSVMPLYVTSKLSKVRKPTWNTPTPRAFARSAVGTIGYEDRTTGYWAHDFCLAVFELLPAAFVSFILWNMHSSIRRIAHKKMQKLQKSQ